MKKIILITMVVFLYSTCFVTYKFYNVTNIENAKASNVKQNNMLSMMLETEANSGNYEMVLSSSWPTDGYIFNDNLSKCENGGKLSWNEETKKVVMKGNISDKCYVYFDIYIPPVYLNNYIISQYTGAQGENNIYYHDSTLTNGAGDNSYRYAGASDTTNNFVCFGSDEETCPYDNLYRIIGVFDNEVKLIKFDYATSKELGTDGEYYNLEYTDEDKELYKGSQTDIASYAWNKLGGENTENGSNTWSTSLLNKTNLNINFIKFIGETWSSKITEHTWIVGGNTLDNIYYKIPSVAYQNEILKSDASNSTDNSKTYTTKIGLMYVSDYAFAAPTSYWNTRLENYSNNTLRNNNWMYMGMGELTITRNSEASTYVFNLYNSGKANDGTATGYYPVRQTFYLKQTVEYVSGTGTQSDSYRVK